MRNLDLWEAEWTIFRSFFDVKMSVEGNKSLSDENWLHHSCYEKSSKLLDIYSERFR